MFSSDNMDSKFVEELQEKHKIVKSLESHELYGLVADAIRENFKGCDMVLTLFITALNSPRSDRCLRPYPKCFVKNNVKDVAFLREMCDKLPPLVEFLEDPSIFSEEMVQLFAWLFIEKGFPFLEKIPFDNTLLPSKVCTPQYMFQVHYSSNSDEMFNERKGDNDLILAYHGSNIDNFYSILKVGLQQHFSIDTETLYGEGIYLSNEFSISAHYSPYGLTWKKSSMGNKHSVIAVCEIIDDYEKVKCKGSKNKKRSFLNRNRSDNIPDKYFLVTDSGYVRLKYLLVYPKKEQPQTESLLKQNIFWMLLILYFLMLVMIGYNGNPVRKILKLFMNL